MGLRVSVVDEVIEGIEQPVLIRLDQREGLEIADAEGHSSFTGGDPENRIHARDDIAHAARTKLRGS
jgi:hypothetical protein